ncbi:MAG: ComF family protein [Saprospiraceae bacterium]
MRNPHLHAETTVDATAALPKALPNILPRPRLLPKVSLAPLRTLLRDTIAQVYPNLCLSCGENHIHINDILCLKCHLNLPETDFHLNQQNKFTERIWGRLPLEKGTALYTYHTHNKDSGVKKLIHKLKYGRRPEVGKMLGEYYGRKLKTTKHFQSVDCIVPVPLHPRKQRMRGYNQSNEFAKGLANSMQIPHHPHGLVRNIFTKTQTQKSRFERFDNVTKVFEAGNRKKLEGKHVLLVDDVLTTGATLEACGKALLEIPDVKVSMATIAIAVH